MKKSGCVILILFLGVCVSVFANLILLGALAGTGNSKHLSSLQATEEPLFEEILIEPGNSQEKIVVIPLTGVIAHEQSSNLGDDMVADFKRALRQAMNDKTVKGVVVSIDSPGGEVTASDVLYHSLKEFSETKPTVAYFNSTGASGAYYTACGADYIMCNATTFTGSIGVIISTLNYRELFGKIGLQSVVFKSGKFKDMLNGAREMTPEEAAYVQELVMQTYGRFVGIVAKSRELDEAALRAGVADGRILSGTDALAAKLVDEIGYVEDAYKKAQELAEVENAQVVHYRRSMSFRNLFRIFGQSEAPSVKVDFLENMPRLKPGQVYLLPPFFAP